MSGSSYHCEAEFTKCWIVHPTNRERELGLDRRETVRIRARSDACARRPIADPAVGGLWPPRARVVGAARASGQVARAALKRNFHRAAGRILCRRLKYATGYCKWQSGLAATIH
ncbi:hypothetical protein V6N13_097294 [Hibiscus sabdariffa]